MEVCCGCRKNVVTRKTGWSPKGPHRGSDRSFRKERICHPRAGRPYDVAIEGKGWLAVQMPDGSEAYTRDGSLDVSVNGVLQTKSGLPVIGDGGPITLPPDAEVMVGPDGTISAKEAGQNVINVVGRFKLVNPPEASLARGADGLFRTPDGAAQAADEAVKIAGGYLEGSNVNVVDQMVTMISLGRQFEMQTRMLQTAEQNDRAAAQVLAAR